MKTSDLIFKDLYKVMVPEIALMSDFEIEEFGIPTTPGLTVEQNAEIAITTCMLPIAKMATLYGKGFNVALCNRTDGVKIYGSVSKHLHAWDTHLTTSINKKKAPTKDLLLLDEFAHTLFDGIKDQLQINQEPDFGVYNDFDTVGINSIKKRPKYDPNITRKSMSGKFKSRVSINKVDMTSI